MRSPIAPLEDDSPLIVDADAVLAESNARQRFESVSRRYAEVFQSGRLIEVTKFAQRRALNTRVYPLDPFKSKQCLSLAIGKRCDHRRIVTQLVTVVK